VTSTQPARVPGKRVILSMGGKGGVGKTSIMTGLAEWFRENQIPVKLLDLDTENKARGSLTHFFGAAAPKVNIHSPAGLDSFVDELTDGAPVYTFKMVASCPPIIAGLPTATPSRPIAAKGRPSIR
jgi:Mrp family chromosome partitioning ATPase